MGLFLDEWLERNKRTPIGGFSPPPEIDIDDNPYKKYAELQSSISTRYPDIQNRIAQTDPSTTQPSSDQSKPVVSKVLEDLQPNEPAPAAGGVLDTDAFGRLLQFMEKEKFPNINEQLVRQGMSNLSKLDTPRRMQFLDALEQTVLQNLESFSFNRELSNQPTLQDADTAARAAGAASMFGSDGQPNNPVFAESFDRDARRNSFKAIAGSAQEASDIFNDIRREVLEEDNALEFKLMTDPNDPNAVNTLGRVLGIEQALFGTGPVPDTATERDFQLGLDENYQPSIEDQEGGVVFGGNKPEPGVVAQGAQALGGFAHKLGRLASGQDESGLDNEIERLITRSIEMVENLGEEISEPDLLIQNLATATANNLGKVAEFFSKEGSDVADIAKTLQEADLVDPDLKTLSRISSFNAAQDRAPVEFRDTGPGIQSEDVAEFVGTMAPMVVLAAVGPGGIPAARIVSTKFGTSMVRVGANAVENLLFEGLAPGPDGQIDALNALAIGAAAGAVFDGAGRIIDKMTPRLLPQSAIDNMIKANPELGARFLNTIDDQLNLLGSKQAAAIEAFERDPAELFNVDDILANTKRTSSASFNQNAVKFVADREIPAFNQLDTLDDVAPTVKKALTGDIETETVDAVLAKSDLEMDDVIADAVSDGAAEVSEASPVSHRVRVYKENIAASLNHLIEQQDFAAAWRVLHNAKVGKHMGKKEIAEVKEVLIKRVEAKDPTLANSLRAMEAQAETIDGTPIVTFGNVLDSPAMSSDVQDWLRKSSAANREITDATKFDPEAGKIINPFADTAAERYMNLDPALRAAVQQGIIADAKPYREVLTRWHNTVQDNLGRLERQGFPEAGPLRDGLEQARFFEEEFQGSMLGRFLRASAKLRPMSRYLMEGGSHHAQLVKRWASNVSEQKQWMADQKPVWDAILNMKSAQEFENLMRDGSPIGKMLDDMFGGRVATDPGIIGMQGDNFFLRLANDQKITFTIQDLHQSMALIELNRGKGSADIIDAWSNLVVSQTTKYARDTFNVEAIKLVSKILSNMKKGGASQTDRNFLKAMNSALKDNGTSSTVLGSLKTTMAITRLSMVAVTNIPQTGHTALMFRAKNFARALWRGHAPEWAGNNHKGRVRQMALNDGSSADSVLNEQANLMADFGRTIPPDLATAAGRTDLSNTPLMARLAQRYQVFGREVVGDIYGLKPMERWLRMIASETGRIHNSNLLMKAQELISTPEGENTFRMAWKIADEINPEDPFFKSVFKNTGGFKKARIQSLVADMRMLGQWKNAGDVMQLKSLSPKELRGYIDKFFDETAVGRIPGTKVDDMPEFVSRSMERSGKFAAEASQFRVGLLDLPISLNAPGTGREIYRAIMQFKTFSYKHFDTIVRRHILDNAKRGNYIPLLRSVGVAFPFFSLTGAATIEFKAWVSGVEVPGGSWIDLGIEYAFGKISGKELDRRLKEMGRLDILAARSLDNFNSWGGLGTPTDVLSAVTGGSDRIAGLLGGAGPVSLASGVGEYFKGIGSALEGDFAEVADSAIKGTEEIVGGGPFSTAKLASRFAREQIGKGRPREELRPTAIERLFASESDTEARVQARDASLFRGEAADVKEERQEDVPVFVDVDRDRATRSKDARRRARESVKREQLKTDYAGHIRAGRRGKARLVELKAKQLGIKINWKSFRESIK